MAVQQISESFQNDGNFSLLDLRDNSFEKKTMRIETFRCSHPDNEFGVTKAGSKAKLICGDDHLKKESNKIFRHVFSVERINAIVSILEIRETFDEDGSWQVIVRDIDRNSQSWGYLIKINVKIKTGGYQIDCGIFSPKLKREKVMITSPLENRISEIMGSDIINIFDKNYSREFHSSINLLKDNSFEINKSMEPIRSYIKKHKNWVENIKLYQRFGDFRDKCVHNGTNLIGSSPQLASEFVLIRAYRSSLILTGAIFDDEMYSGFDPINKDNPLLFDSKPGVYTPFLSAYILNIKIYQLGIDKVHSDYGGVPMKKSPGSLLENGTVPIVSSDKANRTLANIAALLYQPQILEKEIAKDLMVNYN